MFRRSTRGINGYRGANELIEAEVPNWIGEIEFKGELESRYMVAVLDAQTRRWVFQALRDITGQALPNDPAAWRDWWWRS